LGIKSYKNYKRVNQIGTPAVVVVLDLEDTRVTINDNPRIRLRVKVFSKELAPFETTIVDTFSRVDLPRRGDVYYAKFDLRNPSDVIILRKDDAELIMEELNDIKKNILGKDTINNQVYLYGNIIRNEVKDTALWKRATARILSVKDTGRSKDFKPVVILTVEVSGSGIETYTVEKEVALPTFVIKRLVKETTLTAKIDPDDPTHIMLSLSTLNE
jgi:hypothetical protein